MPHQKENGIKIAKNCQINHAFYKKSWDSIRIKIIFPLNPVNFDVRIGYSINRMLRVSSCP